jgi:hypothetical protein
MTQERIALLKTSAVNNHTTIRVPNLQRFVISPLAQESGAAARREWRPSMHHRIESTAALGAG